MQLGRSKLSRILGFLVQESHEGLLGADILAEAPARSFLEHDRWSNRRRRRRGKKPWKWRGVEKLIPSGKVETQQNAMGCMSLDELTITGQMKVSKMTRTRKRKREEKDCIITGMNAGIALDSVNSKVDFRWPRDSRDQKVQLTGTIDISGCIILENIAITKSKLTIKSDTSVESGCLDCVGFQELTITEGSMNLEAATAGCAIHGKNAFVAFATEKSQVVFLPGMKLTGRTVIPGCFELQELRIRTGTLTLKKHASPQLRCVVSGTASIALTSKLQIPAAVTFKREVDIFGCVGFQELTITEGSIHIEPAQSDCVIHGNGATVAFATDTSQLMLFPAVKLTGRVNIHGCIELQDLQIRTGTLTVKQDASPESPCLVNGVDASIAFASDFQFPAVKLEGAVEISDCVVFRDLTITSGSITVKNDLSETGDCVIEADDASVELISRLTFPSTSIRLEGTLEITGCIRLQDILITPGGITFSNDASGNTGCVVHAHDDVSFKFTSDNSRVSFFSATLDGMIDIPECVILQDLTIDAGSVELKRDESAKFLCVVSGKNASVAINSQLVLASVKLEGTVDIVGCVILQELAIAGSLTLKKDPTSTFRCLVTGTNASIALTSQVKFRSVQFDGIIVISGCDILQDLSIRQGEVTLMSSNTGCEVLGQGAVIEFTRSFHVQSLRLSGGIEFTSCGSFYNLKITRVTFTKGGAGNYGCVVEGEDASVVALPDTSRVDFEEVELRGSLDFSTCVSAKDIKIHESSVVFQGCDRQSCMKVIGDFSQEGGSTSFRQCRHGGMKASGSVMLQNSAAMMFDRCGSMGSQGGALHTTGARLRLDAGSRVEVRSCIASKGGGIFAASNFSLESEGHLNFTDCWAEDGGAFFGQGFAKLSGNISVLNSSSRFGGACSLQSGGQGRNTCRLQPCICDPDNGGPQVDPIVLWRAFGSLLILSRSRSYRLGSDINGTNLGIKVAAVTTTLNLQSRAAGEGHFEGPGILFHKLSESTLPVIGAAAITSSSSTKVTIKALVSG